MKLAIAIFGNDDKELLDLCDTIFCRPADKSELSEYKDKLVIVDAGTIHTGYKTIESISNIFTTTYPGKLGIMLKEPEELINIQNVSDRVVYTNYMADGIPTFPHFCEDKDKQLRLLNQTIGQSVVSDNQGEMGFLDLCKQILKEGEKRDDRTKVGTYSVFSPRVIGYDLTDGKVPCFTTKRVPWKSTIKELLWFISGGTDSRDLEEQGVNWWKDNSTREFLDNRGLAQYDVGELGPLYGFQWRYAGANYVPNRQRIEGCGHGEGGVDQLAEVIKRIKEDPSSRRLIVTAYIPQDIPKAVLPPCHSFIQFYVDSNGLSCTLYQRSADMFLGAQINVLSYSILTHMIAKICGIKPYRFYHHIGDAHIYSNHITQMVEQLERPVLEFPTITISGNQATIDDFTISDFKVTGYKPAPTIRAPMAI